MGIRSTASRERSERSEQAGRPSRPTGRQAVGDASPALYSPAAPDRARTARAAPAVETPILN